MNVKFKYGKKNFHTYFFSLNKNIGKKTYVNIRTFFPLVKRRKLG